MERFCGLLGIVARKGRRHPNALIANQMHQHTLILYFNVQFDLGLHHLFCAGHRKDLKVDEDEDPGRIQGSESIYSTSRSITHRFEADLCLSVPTPKGFVPDPITWQQIAKFFPILVTGHTVMRIKDFEKLLSLSMTWWNRLQILAGGDCIRCIDSNSSRSRAGQRDNSFVRVCQVARFPSQTNLNLVYAVS
jgi:hypothetical protein